MPSCSFFEILYDPTVVPSFALPGSHFPDALLQVCFSDAFTVPRRPSAFPLTGRFPDVPRYPDSFPVPMRLPHRSPSPPLPFPGNVPAGRHRTCHSRHHSARPETGRLGVPEPGRPRASFARPRQGPATPPNRAGRYRAANRRHHAVPPIGGTVPAGLRSQAGLQVLPIGSTVPASHRRHHSSGHRSAGAVAPACRHAADRQPLHAAAGIPAAAGSARRSDARPAPHDARRNSAGQHAARRLPGGDRPSRLAGQGKDAIRRPLHPPFGRCYAPPHFEPPNRAAMPYCR